MGDTIRSIGRASSNKILKTFKICAMEVIWFWKDRQTGPDMRIVMFTQGI